MSASWLGLFALAVAALVLAAHRLRTASLHARQSELEDLVRERTQDLEQAVVWATAAVREADTMRAATEALSHTVYLRQLLQLILTELRKVVDYDSASVQELEGSRLRVIAGVGFENLDEILGLTFNVDDPGAPNGEAMRRRAPHILTDTSSYPPFRASYNERAPILSWMGVPLISGDRLIGMIALDSRQPGFYHEEHARLAMSFAAQAAISIENARLFSAARGHAQELERHATALEATANALRESEERSRAILESAHDAFIAMDRHGVITGWNAQAEAIFGWSRSEAVGRRVADTIIPPELREAHARGLARFLATGEGPVLRQRMELRAQRKDGQEFPVELTISAVQLGGEPSFGAFLRDITERKRARQALEQARQVAEDASQAKSAFVASMSHELRTPLNAILGFVQLMERTPGRDGEDREHLSVISRAGEHLLGLINEVLSIAKIESGQMTLNSADFDLASLLRSLGEMFRGRAGSKGLAYSVEIQGRLPALLRGDDGKLRQILINLVGNAIKFTERGEVRVRAAWTAGRATFEVEDTGAGLSAEEATRLFAAFSQAEAGRKQLDGTGLGLALSRSYARLMEGDITLASEPGRGSCFRVEVALPESPQGVESPRSRGRRVKRLDARARRTAILVVDDSADGRVLLSKLLGAVGFDVLSAADGKQGVDVWRESRPDLVFMDKNMPVLDGLGATRAIRAHEAQLGLPRTPIVALTASAFEHERAAIHEAGCDTFLAKPFREEDVFDLLAQTLGVGYVYEEAAPAAVTLATPLTRERLEALPAEWRKRFRAALHVADTQAALRLAAEIERGDAALAGEIVARVKAYRMDELEELLEA